MITRNTEEKVLDQTGKFPIAKTNASIWIEDNTKLTVLCLNSIIETLN